MPKWISVFLIIAIAHMQFAVCGSCGCACSLKSARDACCSESENDNSEHDDDSCHHHCGSHTHHENEPVSRTFDSAKQPLSVTESPIYRARIVESIECQCVCPLCTAHRRSHMAANHLITQPRQDLSKISIAIQATYLTPSFLDFDSHRSIEGITCEPSFSLSILDTLCRLRI